MIKKRKRQGLLIITELEYALLKTHNSRMI